MTPAPGAAVVTALTGHTWTRAHKAATDPALPRTLQGVRGAPAELFFMLACSIIANGSIAAAHSATGLLAGGSPTLRQTLETGSGAVLSYGIATVPWRASSRLTNNVSIHAIGSSTPLFSVTWPLFAGHAGDVSTPLILISATTIAITNGAFAVSQSNQKNTQ